MRVMVGLTLAWLVILAMAIFLIELVPKLPFTLSGASAAYGLGVLTMLAWLIAVVGAPALIIAWPVVLTLRSKKPDREKGGVGLQIHTPSVGAPRYIAPLPEARDRGDEGNKK